MTVGELIKQLADYCPDTRVEIVDGNLLTSPVIDTWYSEDANEPDRVNDGQLSPPNTLYLQGE